MSSSERTTAARLAADPVAQEAGRSVAALFDMLDRADGGTGSVRSRTRRPATYRSAGSRTGAVRTVPLRSVQPAPMARPVPGAAPAPEAAPRPARPSHPTAAQSARRRRPTRLRRLIHRLALWGAGPSGEYLAWGGPARPAPKPVADRPVVLREMPSTPTIQPAAPSPVAAQLPHDPASTGSRGMPPVPRGAVAVPGVRPRGRPERSQATGWPQQVQAPGLPTGLIRTRGDPLSCPARGSPVPAQRSRSPGSHWSSFP